LQKWFFVILTVEGSCQECASRGRLAEFFCRRDLECSVESIDLAAGRLNIFLAALCLDREWARCQWFAEIKSGRKFSFAKPPVLAPASCGFSADERGNCNHLPFFAGYASHLATVQPSNNWNYWEKTPTQICHQVDLPQLQPIT
jgi:hypothetical protein